MADKNIFKLEGKSQEQVKEAFLEFLKIDKTKPGGYTSRTSSSLSIRKSRQPNQVLLQVYPYLCAPNVSFPVGIHTT